MKNNKHRNSNATAAGAEQGVEGDLYILSDGELESIVGGCLNEHPHPQSPDHHQLQSPHLAIAEFKQLANGFNRDGRLLSYKGSKFHRVVKEGMIESGIY